MLNKFTQRMLSVLTLLLLAACGLNPAPEEAQPEATPSIAFSPCDTQPCSWNLVGIGSIGKSPSRMYHDMAAGKNGLPVATYHVEGAGILVKRWNGSYWAHFGGFVPGTASSPRYVLQLGLDDMPWISYLTPAKQISVGRYDGSNWVFISNVPCSDLDRVGGFAMDNNGQPIVACDQANDQIASAQIRVHRYNGSSWLPLPVIENALSPKIAVDANNNIVMAYSDNTSIPSLNVSRFDGHRWRSLGTAGRTTYSYNLKLDASNRPVVANVEPIDGGTRLVVKRWNGKSAFVMVGPAILDPISPRGSTPSLGVKGNLIGVAFAENNLVRVVEHNSISNAWVQKGEAVNADRTNPPTLPLLAYPPSGDPVVAWAEFSPSSATWFMLMKGWSPTPPAPLP